MNWYHHIFFLFKLLFVCSSILIDDFFYKIKRNRSVLKKEDEEDVEGEVVVITGANRGIGKQIATEFAQRGAIVVFGCRNIQKAQETVDEIREETNNNKLIDLMDMDSVDRFSKDVTAKYPKIKLLVNNAGLSEYNNNDPNILTKDGLNPVMAANHFGHFLLTNLLLKNLQNATNPRVIVLTSMFLRSSYSLLDLNDLTMQESGFSFFHIFPYCNSKFCNSLFAQELGKRMKDQGNNLTVYSVCPGYVHTELTKNYSHKLVEFLLNLTGKIVGMTCEEVVSEFVLDVSLSKKLGQRESGLMFKYRQPCNRCNPILKRASHVGEKLWDISAKLVKLDERLKSI